MSLRVVIVGAGVGGLAAAALIARGGFEVSVHEQVGRHAPVGAGVVLGPNAMRVLDVIGVRSALAARAVVLDAGWERRRWADGRVLFVQPLGDECVRRYGVPMCTAHRADLLEALRSAVPAGAVRMAHRCVAVDTRDAGGGAVVHFADGSSVHADVVVGADGIHSVARDAVTEPAPARFIELSAYRCLVPTDSAPEVARRPVQTLWLGPGRHLVHYPVSDGELINVVGVVPTARWRQESWSTRGEVADLAAEFAGWDPRVGELIAAAPSTARWALFDRLPLPTWSRGPVTVLGDAAHAMAPMLAQGAAQALEDAAVLARCLAEDARPGPALERYDRRRRPRASQVQRASYGLAEPNHLPDGPEQVERDHAFTHQDPLARHDWIYGYDATAP